MDVIGYGNCTRCGAWELRPVLTSTGGYCHDCTGSGHHPARLNSVIVEGTQIKLPRKPKTGSRGNPDTKRARRSAEEAARRRLARKFPGTYRVILAEERAKRGLDPVPIPRVPPQDSWETETDAVAPVYHLADRR